MTCDLLPDFWTTDDWKIPVMMRGPERENDDEGSILESTFYNWRKKYSGLLPSEMRRLKQLEEENGKLKKLVADLSLDRAMLQDVIKRKL